MPAKPRPGPSKELANLNWGASVQTPGGESGWLSLNPSTHQAWPSTEVAK